MIVTLLGEETGEANKVRRIWEIGEENFIRNLVKAYGTVVKVRKEWVFLSVGGRNYRDSLLRNR